MQNLTQKEGKSQSKLEEEERQTTEDALEKLNEVQINVLWVFFFASDIL